MDSGKFIGAIYIDLTKAFDTIGHNALIDKLPKFGICGKPDSQTVEINNCRSVVEHRVLGVPKGSILEPRLFIMFYITFQATFKAVKS